jgi:hypothetical protein
VVPRRWRLKEWNDETFGPCAACITDTGELDPVVPLVDDLHPAHQKLRGFEQLGPALGLKRRQFANYCRTGAIPLVNGMYELIAMRVYDLLLREIGKEATRHYSFPRSAGKFARGKRKESSLEPILRLGPDYLQQYIQAKADKQRRRGGLEL